MPLAQTTLRAITRLLTELVRGLIDGVGALVQNIGKLALALAVAATPFYLIWLAGRSADHQHTPPIFWQAIPTTWLACALVWQTGWLVRAIAHPAQLRRQQPAARAAPVSAQRIHEWDAAWQRAIDHQQHARHHRHTNDEHASPNGQHARGRDQRHGSQSTPGWAYQTLGLHTHATPQEVRAAYHELAKRLHPDRNPDFPHQATDRFRDIQAAYEILSHPRHRHGRQTS
ncbi:MAG: J domain-containing protein [Solirubrobacteraceae bacterium]|jgi:hypothetical protein